MGFSSALISTMPYTYGIKSLESFPSIYKAIKDRQIFYVTDPSYKNESRTDSVIEIIKAEKGFQF